MARKSRGTAAPGSGRGKRAEPAIQGNGWLDDFVPYQLYRVTNKLNARLLKRLKTMRINSSQWRVLSVLRAYGPLSIGRIVETTLMEQPTTSRVVAQLERVGHVEAAAVRSRLARGGDLDHRGGPAGFRAHRAGGAQASEPGFSERQREGNGAARRDAAQDREEHRARRLTGSVVDARIFAGVDHADDVHAVRRSALQGVHVLAREEDHVAGPHRGARACSFQITPSPDTITSASS